MASIKTVNSAGQLELELALHFRPFGIDDAEIDGMAEAAAGSDHVIAEEAFFFSADARKSIARFFIERIGFEFHADAAQRLEGVAQKKIFCFGVDGGALMRGSDPGPADFEPMVNAVDVGVTRAAHGSAAGFFYKREGERDSA